MLAWVQEDDCNWGDTGGGRGGGATPFILLHVMSKIDRSKKISYFALIYSLGIACTYLHLYNYMRVQACFFHNSIASRFM